MSNQPYGQEITETPVGDSELDCQIGNLLNAIDHVVKYYTYGRGVDEKHAAAALRMYADYTVEAFQP